MLDAKDFLVAADIARAETLPARAFIDPEVLERELATIFASSWLMVPERAAEEQRADGRSLADLVARRGARAPAQVLEKPLFLVRDWKGTLRCFPNVCTHAWHTLVQGPERERTLTCPQHGRQFDLDGRFLAQPGFEKAPGFPRDCDHLQAVSVAAWAGKPFIALGAPAAPFEEVFADVAATTAAMGVEGWPRAPMAGEVRDLEGNWKQHAWNYLDSLHIPYVHRKPHGLADAVDMASYRTEVGTWSVLQWAWARDPADGFDPRAMPPRLQHKSKRVFALWWFVWPNLTLNLYPWGMSVNVYNPVPGQPQRTRFHWYHYVADAAKHRERDARWKMREVDDEDVEALAQVARGVRSALAPRGRFAAGREEAPHWFHRRVYEGLFAATLEGRRGAAPREPRRRARRTAR
ncbi:MAG TPA: SRPBCC family protein [Candidatus Thermoplasmatota archaeon]|jgi:choline monooxygenase|nr:SRPBCC family protein [Candidatus Thermoplasmatota archaeon]